MLASEREDFGRDVLGPTLVVCPMSVVKQWGAEIARFAPSLRVHLHHGTATVRRRGAHRGGARTTTSSSRPTTSPRGTSTRSPSSTWDRLLLDEAQDVKNPATKRARALRRLPARRQGRDDRHADREPARRALGDHGHRQPGPARLPRLVRAHVRAADRVVRERRQALERLRSIVQPFILRRAKDSPEVELELPPITIAKDYCRLTVEQASLYRATVDRWLPRDRGARRPLRPPRRRARDAQPAEAGLQPPGDAARRPASRWTAAPASSTGSSSCSSRCRTATRRSSSRSTPASTGSCRTSSEQLGKRVGFFHGRLNARQREDLLRRVRDGGRPVRARDLDQGGRTRPQPAGREPRLPLRPLVEPGGRAAGHRPRAPVRPAQARVRAQPDLHRHARGADRPAARLEARARARA